MKIMLFIFVPVLMLFSVWEHAEMVQLGYEIERMKREKLDQHKRQQALLVEYYGLISFDRIEDLAATQLGLIRPHPEQVVLIYRR